MSPRERLAGTARLLVPLRQGDLDELCGLYALVNAARLLLHPVRSLQRPQLRQLFARGIDRLGAARQIKGCLLDGMDEPLWGKLADAVLDQAGELAGVGIERTAILEIDRQLDTRDAVRLIKHYLRDGQPILAMLAGRYNHWTVISGYSATRLTLFDSYDYRWVTIGSIVLDDLDGASDKPHILQRHAVVALRFQPLTKGADMA